MLLNIWDSIKKVKSNNTINIQDYLYKIKNGDSNLEYIKAARSFDKNINRTEYDNIKISKLPVVSFQTYIKNGYRKDYNIESYTKILYFDFDFDNKQDAINKKEELSKLDFVYSVWISLSEYGVGCLVKVTTIDHDSFINVYDFVLTKFNNLNGFDDKAKSRGRVNVLSYDPNIYINLKSEIIDTSHIQYEEDFKQQKIFDIIIKTYDQNYNTNNDKFLFTKILSEYNEDCVYIEKGLEYFCAYLPFEGCGKVKKIQNGDRNKVFSLFTHNLVILNKDKKIESFITLLNYLNKKFCVNPFSEQDIKKIVENKYKNRKVLIPIGIVMKKYWVNPEIIDKRLTFYSKRKEVTLEYYDRKIKEFLSDEMYNYNKPVILQDIADYIDVSISTINKYINSEFSEIISNYNKKFDYSYYTKSRDKIDIFFEKDIFNFKEKITLEKIANFLGFSIKTIKRNITDKQKLVIKNFNKSIKT